MRNIIHVLALLALSACGSGLNPPPTNEPKVMGLPCDLARFDDSTRAWVYVCQGMPGCNWIVYAHSDGSTARACCGSETTASCD